MTWFKILPKAPADRSMTRDVWYKEYRYCRLMTKVVAANIDEKSIDADVQDLLLYGARRSHFHMFPIDLTPAMG